MRIRKSELKALVEEVLSENEMEEALSIRQQKITKGARTGGRPNEKKITQLFYSRGPCPVRIDDDLSGPCLGSYCSGLRSA